MPVRDKLEAQRTLSEMVYPPSSTPILYESIFLIADAAPAKALAYPLDLASISFRYFRNFLSCGLAGLYELEGVTRIFLTDFDKLECWLASFLRSPYSLAEMLLFSITPVLSFSNPMNRGETNGL